MATIFNEPYLVAAKDRYDFILEFNKIDNKLKNEKYRPLNRTIDGKYFPVIIEKESFVTAKKLLMRFDDIFVVSYPKSGSTWIREIVLRLINDKYVASGVPQFFASPYLECFGSKVLDMYPSPRVIKTHFNFNDCPKNNECKYIYIIRNPKDVLINYYQYVKSNSSYCYENGTFNDFFNHFISSKMEFGTYFESIKSWLSYLDRPNVLFLVYEDFCKDIFSNIIRIINFIGGSIAEKYKDNNKLQIFWNEIVYYFSKHNYIQLNMEM
uniref:Sulfotransfer_1 domain-containing protein n=1 Tax=Parastrongyloides trichosuri TaxID=131310 RepID=A0A0N5A6K7_PARTI